ncbi:MAG: hypothetical protein JSC189_000631 [Candidatus Tokpelaia sp. JSC189]|nr:MAG: hypothetical protein JSC189_000631 [Candidatus Tokpelaia sp. JSC189]
MPFFHYKRITDIVLNEKAKQMSVSKLPEKALCCFNDIFIGGECAIIDPFKLIPVRFNNEGKGQKTLPDCFGNRPLISKTAFTPPSYDRISRILKSIKISKAEPTLQPEIAACEMPVYRYHGYLKLNHILNPSSAFSVFYIISIQKYSIL